MTTTAYTNPLDEPGFLTEAQFAAAEHEGNMFLVACPGGGKTRTAAVRVARLVRDGTRVAACSYTNVGVEQIRAGLSDPLRVVMGPEHFAGTLHRLLLTYVFYPFGHLVMGCAGRPPRLAADESHRWRDVIYGDDPKRRLAVSSLRLCVDGSLHAKRTPRGLSPEEAATAERQQALSYKKRHAQDGFATFDDSMFFALRVLQRFEWVRAAVASRFDEILIDEAQDTSEVQLECVRLIAEAGLDSLVLVGDIEQSIYSFQGASPVNCRKLADDRGLETVELIENHRSSQLICDVAAQFCERAADTAVGADKDCTFRPKLITYDPDAPEEILAVFRQELEATGIDAGDAAIVTRRHEFKDILNGDTDPEEVQTRPLSLGRACAALRGHRPLTRKVIEAAERVVAFCAFDVYSTSELDPELRWALRRATMRLLGLLPDLGLDLRDWITQARPILADVAKSLADPLANKPQHAFKAPAASARTALETFAPGRPALRAQTVHAVKGASRDAVMVVFPPISSRSKRRHEAALWVDSIEGKEIEQEELEERRIAFVAVSRARRLCILAAPKNLPLEQIAHFEAAGFDIAA